MNQHPPQSPDLPQGARKKVVRIKLVPINPESQLAAMGPLKPACPPGAGSGVVGRSGNDEGPSREPAAIQLDAPRDFATERRIIEHTNAALARQQAARAAEAAKDAASHLAAAGFAARSAAFLAALAAWHSLLHKGPLVAKGTGKALKKVTYDVFIKVVADIIREVLVGKH